MTIKDNYVPLNNFYINGTKYIPTEQMAFPDIIGNIYVEQISSPLQDIAGNFVHPEELKCSICNKKIRVGLSHNQCRRIKDKYERAKQKMLDTEFQLFCLKYE